MQGEQLSFSVEQLGDLHPARWGPGVSARAEISRLQANGLGPTAIARSLNARGVPTPTGRGRWWESTVRRHGDPYTAERWRAYIAARRARERAAIR